MAHRSEKEKMLAGELYLAQDPELLADNARASLWMDRFNATHHRTAGETETLLREGLGAVGAGTVVRPPFFCDYGIHITLGAGVFINFNCVILDVCPVTIGDDTMLAPGVQILTADHPREPGPRAAKLEFGRPIAIGRNAWIGAGALILPGVQIGDEAVVAAGAVVTRDVAPGATVAGTPARPVSQRAP